MPQCSHVPPQPSPAPPSELGNRISELGFLISDFGSPLLALGSLIHGSCPGFRTVPGFFQSRLFCMQESCWAKVAVKWSDFGDDATCLFEL